MSLPEDFKIIQHFLSNIDSFVQGWYIWVVQLTWVFSHFTLGVQHPLIRANALNQTGDVNYNKNGLKDGVGFVEVTDKFVDNFLFRTLVPNYNTKKGRNIFIGTQNKMIRDLLDTNGLKKVYC